MSNAPARASDANSLPERGNRAHWLLFGLLWSAGAVVDLTTKHWVFDWLGLPGQRAEWWLIEPYVGLQTALNTGALFGVGQGKVLLFAAISVVALGGIVAWLAWGGAIRERMLTIALGMIAGGVTGNLYDRLGLWITPDLREFIEPAVRDWILLRWGDFTWPNFNIADALLVIGAGLLVLHSLRPSPASSTPGETPGEAAAGDGAPKAS